MNTKCFSILSEVGGDEITVIKDNQNDKKYISS